MILSYNASFERVQCWDIILSGAEQKQKEIGASSCLLHLQLSQNIFMALLYLHKNSINLVTSYTISELTGQNGFVCTRLQVLFRCYRITLYLLGDYYIRAMEGSYNLPLSTCLPA